MQAVVDPEACDLDREVVEAIEHVHCIDNGGDGELWGDLMPCTPGVQAHWLQLGTHLSHPMCFLGVGDSFFYTAAQRGAAQGEAAKNCIRGRRLHACHVVIIL